MTKQTSPNTNKDILAAIYEQGIIQLAAGTELIVLGHD